MCWRHTVCTYRSTRDILYGYSDCLASLQICSKHLLYITNLLNIIYITHAWNYGKYTNGNGTCSNHWYIHTKLHMRFRSSEMWCCGDGWKVLALWRCGALTFMRQGSRTAHPFRCQKSPTQHIITLLKMWILNYNPVRTSYLAQLWTSNLLMSVYFIHFQQPI